jgi:Spy/CpxP family protein refolding chaperone
MKGKGLIVALIVSLGINAGVIGTVIYRMFEGRESFHRFHDRLWQHSPLRHELDLTESQLDELERLREGMSEGIEPLRLELREKRDEMIGLLREDEPERERIEALAREIANSQAELGVRIFDHLLDVRDILSEEQRLRVIDLFERELHPRDRFPGPFGAPPGGPPGGPPERPPK